MQCTSILQFGVSKSALVQEHVHHRESLALRNKPPLKVSGPTGIRYRQHKSGYTRTPITSSAHIRTKTRIDHTVKMSDVAGASPGASVNDCVFSWTVYSLVSVPA